MLNARPSSPLQAPSSGGQSKAAASSVQGAGERRLSCGIVILNAQSELLLCHVTGQDHWDLPKGGIDDGETPLQAALRETREETGLRLDDARLLDIGRVDYRPKKALHLFATLQPRFDTRTLHCDSHFREYASGDALPEMDAYEWVALADVAAYCTPRMATVLTVRIDLAALLAQLSTAAAEAQPSAQRRIC